MDNSILDILINPDTFFGKRVADKENLKTPALIVLAGAIIGAIYGYMVSGLTGRMLAGLMPGMETIIIIATIAGALIGSFLFWAIWAGVFYVISKAFKGTGTYKRSLEVVGYGFLPQIIGSLITLIVSLQYIPKVVVPQLTSAALQDPTAITEATKALMHDPAMMELTQIASVIAIVFLLWSANCWIFGMKHARTLSMRDAAICVGAPVFVYVLYIVYSMAGV
ncbi:MAG: Yip1 family protein [Methanoregula sp.]|jgi:hypothetical protein